MERIYLLEDDDSIRKLVIYALGSQGYEAQGFDRPSDFWSAMEGPQPALILLDIMLPEEDGLSILQKLRASAATKRIPVIMLTAKNMSMTGWWAWTAAPMTLSPSPSA